MLETKLKPLKYEMLECTSVSLYSHLHTVSQMTSHVLKIDSSNHSVWFAAAGSPGQQLNKPYR